MALRKIRVLAPSFALAIVCFASWPSSCWGYSGDTLVVLNESGYRQSVSENPRCRLVQVDSLISGILFDIRYSTEDNFTGKKIYSRAAAYVRLEVAAALRLASDSLRSLGMGLILYDAYRPYSATVQFWNLIGDERYVANPARGSRHNRGCAVDVGLYDLIDGKPLLMPTTYDDFSERAHADAVCEEPAACRNRRVLQLVMMWAGFRVFETEWWHFDFKGWEEFQVLDVSFEELKSF